MQSLTTEEAIARFSTLLREKEAELSRLKGDAHSSALLESTWAEVVNESNTLIGMWVQEQIFQSTDSLNSRENSEDPAHEN